MRHLKLSPLIFIIVFFNITATANTSKYLAKIAVVDVESILENSIAISYIRKTINELGENIQKELTSKQEEFSKREQELIELQKTLPKEKFEPLAAKFNKNVSVAQKNFKVKKLALEQAHTQSVEIVHKATISIIAELAKKYDINIVLPSTNVLFIKNELNITPEVLSKLNERLQEVSINYETLLKRSRDWQR